MDAKTIQAELAQFTGTEAYHLLSPFHRNKLVATDGVKFLADVTGCYWLMDIIVFEFVPELRGEEFVLFTLTVDDKSRAVLVADDGNGNVLKKRKIDYTDFPLREVKLYLCDGVIMLVSEY